MTLSNTHLKNNNCVCLLVFLTLFISLTHSHAENSRTENAVPVTVKPLGQLVFHPIKKAPGHVVALQNSLLSAELSALVENIDAQVGDQVQQDKLLLTLECDDFILAKQQLAAEKKALEAERYFAAFQYERSERLLKSKNVSQELHRRHAAGLRKLEAQIQLLLSKIQQSENKISRCEIKAPFPGIIVERLIHLGEIVAPGTPLIRLINVDKLEVEVQMPIQTINDLHNNSLTFVHRDQHYPLELRAIIPSIETRARHQRGRLRFSDKKALPNAFGMVEITRREFTLPANYLLTRNTQVGLFLLKKIPHTSSKSQFKAHFYAIKGALMGRSATLDLPLNTQIIVDGRNALTDGQRVTVKNNPSAKRVDSEPDL